MKVKNAIVTMDWDVEDFFESKKDGFLAAVQTYTTSKGDCCVMFKGNKAFMIYNDDKCRVCNHDEIAMMLKEAVKDGGSEVDFEEFYPDNYIEVSTNGSVDEDIASIYGMDESVVTDIEDRFIDISKYYYTKFED